MPFVSSSSAIRMLGYATKKSSSSSSSSLGIAFAAAAAGGASTNSQLGRSEERIAGCEEAAAFKSPQTSSINAKNNNRPANLQQRMTAIGRFSILSETEHNPSIISFLMVLKGEPLSKNSFVELWQKRRMMELHPRFQQVLSNDRPGYFDPQKQPEPTTTATASSSSSRSEDDNNDLVSGHVTETLYPMFDFKKEMERRISDIQKEQWDLSDSLWHVYVAPGREQRTSTTSSTTSHPVSGEEELGDDDDVNSNNGSESLVIFRGHHALADGASMGAAMMDLVDEAEDIRGLVVRNMNKFYESRMPGKRSIWQRMYRKLQQLVWLITGSLRAGFYQFYLLSCAFLEPNPWKQLEEDADDGNGGDNHGGITTTGSNRRTVSWTGSAAPVDQVKWVARALSGPYATINDVFVSCVTAALARQLAHHRQRLESLSEGDPSNTAGPTLPKQRHMHVSVPVHLKGGVVLPGESVGNNLGAFVVRLPGESDGYMNPADRLEAVHERLAAVKRTPTPLLSNLMAKTLSYGSYIIPSRVTSWIYSRANASSVAVVTNTRGPSEPVHLDGRRIEALYGFIPLPPGLPVGVVVSSYAGKMTLTVTAESWAVPDGDQFLSWVLEEYLDLLNAASRKAKLK